MVEITAAEQNREKLRRMEDNLRDLWDNIKYTNIQIICIPEEEKKKRSEKIYEEIIVKTSPTWERK